MIVEAQCARTRWGLYRREKSIGAKHLGFPAIQLCVPVGIVAVQQDNISRSGEMGGQCHPVGPIRWSRCTISVSIPTLK
jgi:hypothetical protein